MTPTAASDPRPPAEVSRVALPLATLALLGYAVWRVRLGVDVADGAHVVALAMRLAEGDQVLTDEMNLQALGSLAAVPFTWLWLQVAGVEGVVLASRLFYVALATGVGAVCYRALRTLLPPVAAWTAVVLMLLPTPYNLLVTSYNSMPVLMLGLAVCSAAAALTRGSARWAATSGVALAMAVLAHPSSLPAAATLGVVVLVLAWRRRAVLTGLLLGGALASALVLAVIAAGPGLDALARTVTYTADYQASRPAPQVRLGRAAWSAWHGLVVWRHLPVAALALLATAPLLRRRGQVAAAAAIPAVLAALLWAVAPTEPTRDPFGVLSGAYAVLLTCFLLLPVGAWTLRERVRPLRLLLLLTLPVAVLGAASFSLVTSASASWGVAAPPVQPLFGALGGGLVLWAGGAGRADSPRSVRDRLSTGVVALVVVASLLAVHPLRSFRNADPARLTATVASGPMAGLRASPAMWQADCALQEVVTGWVRPGEGVFFYAEPGGYAYSRSPMATNLLWLADFGAANAETVRWWERTGRWPQVAVLRAALVEEAGGPEALAADDPVVAALLARLGPPQRVGEHLVMRDGAPPAATPRPSPAGCPAPRPGPAPAAGIS